MLDAVGSNETLLRYALPRASTIVNDVQRNWVLHTEGVLGGNACKPRCPTSCACNKELCPKGSEVSEEVSGYRKSCKAFIIFQPRQSCP